MLPVQSHPFINAAFKFGGLVTNRQFAKFSSLPNLIDIRYNAAYFCKTWP